MQLPLARPQDASVSARVSAEFAEILTPEALVFIARLHRKFESRRQELLARRAARQQEFDAGKLPDFLPETSNIKEDESAVAPHPKHLLKRRFYITERTDRKIVIHSLNSGA